MSVTDSHCKLYRRARSVIVGVEKKTNRPTPNKLDNYTAIIICIVSKYAFAFFGGFKVLENNDDSR